MALLRGFVRWIERLNEAVGGVLSYATLACVVICFLVAVLRYVAGVGFVWMQEAYVWLHAAVFLVGAGFTFKVGGHVRVDLFYRPASARRRAWIDLFGCLFFLFPWLIVVTGAAWRFFAASYVIGESSGQPGGLPALYVLKFMLVAFCLLVGLQGLALMARSILVLRGEEDFASRLEGEGEVAR
ncbi:TRAP transporter small permease subunit [Zavarzinia aquatilis]|uniref:TRAP transporter small permease protein n=1 Tax=Zavarzinia aquatilis TaxID=2211142 RepID=A0A317ECS7_9PROT|nr:TRAP transporter small permease subunit [Zavarzinia aquatilis]PWR24838.1 C4-dicarboxylate ABC transporter permease [Zavarzinia aquatilis]